MPVLREPVQARSTIGALMVAGSHPSIPLPNRLATRFWGILSSALIIGGIVYAFWGGWYWSIIGVVAGLLVERANRRSATQFVLRAAEDNDWFRDEMIAKGVLQEVPVDPAFLDELRKKSTTVYWDGEKMVERR